MNYSLFELNNTIDAKLTRLGKSIDTNIIQNFVIFGIFTFPLLALNMDLPIIYGIKSDIYLLLVPIVLVFLFVRFGFITLRFLNLMVERDKAILEIVKKSNYEIENLKRLKNVYRQSSFGEVFYKSLIFKGIEFKGYKEELTKFYKPFTFVWIILVVVTNTLLTVGYLYKYLVLKNYYFFIILIIGIIIITICYVDYYLKIKQIKKEMRAFYLDWKTQYKTIKQ